MGNVRVEKPGMHMRNAKINPNNYHF